MKGKKLVHYIRHAKGANLSTQSQFLRSTAVRKDPDGMCQRAEFLPKLL